MRTLLTLLLLMGGTLRADYCLIIGDSLSKEYEVEFVGLYPDNPAAWQARNWTEILHQRRSAWFGTGTLSAYAPPRLTGHKYNWAFPGATSTEIKTQMTSILSYLWIGELEDHLHTEVDRVVIFIGGNDADSYYASLYNGTATAAVTNTTLSNIQWLVNYVRSENATIPIALVSVPHVGCTPQVQQGYPTDPIKTARVTAVMDFLNANLAAFAQTKGIAFVPGIYEFTKAMITQPVRIRGIEFYLQADADCRPRFLFSGDGFHPNTNAHAKIAQMIVAAFNAKYPATACPPLGDLEIITSVLGLDPDIPFLEWMAGKGWTGGFEDDFNQDGIANGMAFAVEQPILPAPTVENGALTLTYLPNVIFTEWGVLKARSSPDLVNWSDVPAGQTVTNPDGSITVSVPFTGRGFLRLQATK